MNFPQNKQVCTWNDITFNVNYTLIIIIFLKRNKYGLGSPVMAFSFLQILQSQLIKSIDFGTLQTWIWVPVLLFIGYMILGKLIKPSEPQ